MLAIANAMLQRRTITGEDIDAIYHGTRGPTVDGAWYHLPTTRLRLEDFHVAAVAAHETHEVSFDLDPPATPMASVADPAAAQGGHQPGPLLAAAAAPPWVSRSCPAPAGACSTCSASRRRRSTPRPSWRR